MRREVPVTGARLPSRRQTAIWAHDSDRLAGQSGSLPEIRCIVLEGIASLLCDDVENCPLAVPIFGGCTKAFDLHLFNYVDVWLGRGTAATWAGEVRAIEEKGILIYSTPKNGNPVVIPAGGRGR